MHPTLSARLAAFPLQTLLDAAGIGSLDSAGGDIGGRANQTLRYAGIVVLLQLTYSNYYLPPLGGGLSSQGTGSFNGSQVRYSYSVTVVPNAEFKVEAYEITSNASGILPAPYRVLYNRHGVRVVIQQTGHIGFFDFQTLLINVVVGLGLLAAANVFVDLVATCVCPQRFLYRRYMYRTTVALGDLVSGASDDGGAAAKALMARVRDDPYSIDGVPPVLQEAVAARRERHAARLARKNQVALAQHAPRALQMQVLEPSGSGATELQSSPSKNELWTSAMLDSDSQRNLEIHAPPRGTVVARNPLAQASPVHADDAAPAPEATHAVPSWMDYVVHEDMEESTRALRIDKA